MVLSSADLATTVDLLLPVLKKQWTRNSLKRDEIARKGTFILAARRSRGTAGAVRCDSVLIREPRSFTTDCAADGVGTGEAGA